MSMYFDHLLLSVPLENTFAVVLSIWRLVGVYGKHIDREGSRGDSVLCIDVGETYFGLSC